MNTLNLIFIKYFCDSVKFGSISKASKINYISQSAISQGIAKLEQSLGISLLAHHPNRFRVTPEGSRLFEKFMNLIRESEEIQNMISNGEMDYMGDLAFSSTYSFALSVIPKYIKKFIAEYPQVKLNLSLNFPEAVKENVKHGRIDFGILPDFGDLENFNKQVIYSGKFQLYSKKGIPKESFEQLKFIIAGSFKETIHLKKAYFNKFKREIQEHIVVDTWEMIAKLASEGVGIGYLPDYFASERADLALQVHNLGLKTETYQMVAISPKGMKLRKSSETFLSYLLATNP